MPTFEEIENKLKDIKEAMVYEFKEEDIEKVVSCVNFYLFLQFLFTLDKRMSNDNLLSNA